MRRFAAIVFALSAVAAAPAAQQSIVGVWYEEANYGGSRVISVWDIKADGTYSSVYRRCLDTGEEDSHQEGNWTYTNGRMHTVSATSSLRYFTNEYQTISNDGRVWVYRAVSGDGYNTYGPVTFRDTRVTPDAKLPTCATTS